MGKRALTMARVYNLREGFTEKDDWLPPRFFKPRASGILKAAVNSKDLQRAKLLYYDMMGWSETGVPKQSALEELDIGWASDKICF